MRQSTMTTIRSYRFTSATPKTCWRKATMPSCRRTKTPTNLPQE
jgi:hypothetical protein